MSRTTFTARRLGTVAIAAVLALAVAAPGTASTRPDDRPGALGVGGALVEQPQGPTRPDDRADRRIVPAANITPTGSVADDDAFGWGDVAGVAFFVTALGIGAVSLLYTRRHLQSA